MSILNEYLSYLNEFGMPAMGLMPAKRSTGYNRLSIYAAGTKKITSDKGEDDEDKNKVEEYTSYNPHGSGYGMMLQRWNLSGSAATGANTAVQSSPSSQKQVTKNIVIKLKGVKKRSKKQGGE